MEKVIIATCGLCCVSIGNYVYHRSCSLCMTKDLLVPVIMFTKELIHFVSPKNCNMFNKYYIV